MKSLIALTTFAVAIASISAASFYRDTKAIELLTNELSSNADGSYKFSYTLSDGTTRTEEATIRHTGPGNGTLTIRGNVTWKGPDGNTYSVDFIADENGYQPRGEHLPK